MATWTLAATLLPAMMWTGMQPAASPKAGGCIETPADYKHAFESCAPIRCVGTDLYGVIGQGRPKEQFSIYPPSFHWAWVSGYENLERYARWQHNACQGRLPPSEVTQRILLYVGFGKDEIVKRSPYTLTVMDLGTDPTLFVPSWQAWFQAFGQRFGVHVPLAAQKAMTLGLGDRTERTTAPLDPTRNFADVTGCSPTAAAACSDAPLSACSRDYAKAARALKPHSPIEGTGSTAECAAAFQRHVAAGQGPVSAAQARALLRYCQDVNPCNSGAGLGFNPAFPLRGGDLLDHFTGREFVLLNQPLANLDAARVALTPP